MSKNLSSEPRSLVAGERDSCIDLWRRVWPGRDRESFARYLYGDPDWQPEYTRVIADDGRIVSCVHICKRMVALGEHRLTMGGIANAATLDEYRGRGLNTACLHSAVEIMAADAMDFSLLFTAIPDYYARALFEELPFEEITGTFTSAAGAHQRGTRPAVATDLREIAAIYRAYNSRRAIAVQRTDDYWRNWLRFDETVGEYLCAIDESGNVEGYCRYRLSGPFGAPESLVVSEFGARAGNDEQPAASRLLAAAAANLPEGSHIRLRLAVTPAVLRAAKEFMPHPLVTQRRGAMARLLNAEVTISGLMGGWNERWLEAGQPRGSAWFELPDGPMQIDAGGALLRMNRSAPPPGVRPISQGSLFRLLIGAPDPVQPGAPREAEPLLEALFPRGAPVFWSAEGF